MTQISDAATGLPLAPAGTPRLALVDVLRGIAIVCMVAYHLAWDLSYLGFWPIDISVEPGWIVFQRCILGTFLFLVGLSLVLGHGERVRWPAFWRRLAILAAASLAMSLGTYILFQDAFAFFGILHAIFLFSLIAVLCLRLPIPVLVVASAAIIVGGIVVHSEGFNTRWLAWIGFWTEPPRTADLVSVLPWLGVTLLGIAAGRLFRQSGVLERWSRWPARRFPARQLRFLGRWSLLIYLVHQLVLLGVLYPLALWLQPGIPDERQSFVEQCQPSCLATGGVAGYCEAYCSCALDTIEHDRLWPVINAQSPTVAERQQIDHVIDLCRAMAE